MRLWMVAPDRRYCGRCGSVIRPGTVALRVTFARSMVPVWRCTDCEPPPPGLILDAEPAPVSTFTARVADLVARFTRPDWKRRQSGDPDQ